MSNPEVSPSYDYQADALRDDQNVIEDLTFHLKNYDFIPTELVTTALQVMGHDNLDKDALTLTKKQEKIARTVLSLVEGASFLKTVPGPEARQLHINIVMLSTLLPAEPSKE